MNVEPGQDCPTCEQRVPFPKGPTSPPTKKMGYWLPAEDYDDHEFVVTEAAKHLGCYERPFWQWVTATMAMTLVLQDESLRGFAHRGPH